MPPHRHAALAAVAVALAVALPAGAADPVFENRTPVGFVPADSTTGQDFVSGSTVHVRVDLNQAASPEHPVIGHFHAVERAVARSATDTDGQWVDVAMADDYEAAIHMAWIEASAATTGPVFSGGSTPAYEIYYAHSSDGGASFSAPVSVSSGVSYYLLTVDGGGTAFSTLDLEVDSQGNPRVAYAFITTADRSHDGNVYLAYSQDGGDSWESPLVVNDRTTVGTTQGRRAAFPRLAIDDRDRPFVAYVRGTSQGGGSDDVMLAKVDHHADPFALVPVGSLGTVGSSGGVRLSPDGKRHTGPDLAVGDGDALHVVWFSDADERLEHKRLATDTTWVDVGASGWRQDSDGAAVAAFDDEAADNAALGQDATFYFATVVVDRQRLPDRAYALYKWADGTPAESIGFTHWDDDGSAATAATWATPQTAWSTGATPLFAAGAGAWEVELDWTITERVAAVVDAQVPGERGNLHIAFTAGHSGGGEHDVYLATYNGTSWTLPEKVADDDSDGAGTEDGIAAADVWLSSVALARHPDGDNLYLAFAGGAAEGFGVRGVADVDQHPYIKVLGRALTWEDRSVPVGAYQYTLSYTPVNPQTPALRLADRPVYVHAADAADGSGLGAQGRTTDGFLAGTWERVGTSLQDAQKRFEGRVDDSPGDSREWGDDGDKVGLLVKLNVLGADSSTNLQVVTASSAAARSVAVGAAPPVGLAPGTFFALGADIDIVAANAAPVVALHDPDGVGDTANTAYTIRYDLTDGDDDLSGSLDAAFYVYRTATLRSVQDVRIFGTLIADQNDVSARHAAGTDDLTEGSNQTYTWDDPPTALQSGALFASILKVPSGTYYVYLVANDGDNPPVFAVSPGAVTVAHAPLVVSVDPIAADTVDTGVRSGQKANPYDLDFHVVDYDGEARVQLFYAAVSGIASVSASGTYPDQTFVLGKSLAGVRGTAITPSTSLTVTDHQLAWDVTDPLIPQGAYYLYAVASDGTAATVGNSGQRLVVAHSPSFAFYEPARNTQRHLDSGSQPVYAIQWQKGSGDGDLDDDARISLYYTTVDPAVTDYSGADSTGLTDAGDGDAQLIVGGLREDDDGPADIHVWDLRTATQVPESGQRVWLYAVLSDDGGNVTVVLGGSLRVTHSPYILLRSGATEINQGDIVRLAWDDYLVDDGSGTDDAYLRLYASPTPGRATAAELEAAVVGAGGAQDTWIVNSADGTAAGALTSIREDSSDAYAWDTLTPTFALPVGTYSLYAAIGTDATFADNAAAVSEAPTRLTVKASTGTSPHMQLSPNRLRASAGDTLTFDVLVHTGAEAATAVTAALNLDPGLTVVDAGSPCTDLGAVFVGGTVLENTTDGGQLRFAKTGGPQVVGAADAPVGLARFRVVLGGGASGTVAVVVDDEAAAIVVSGRTSPLRGSTGMSTKGARIQRVARGRIVATVLLEGRAPPLGNGDHGTLLDVHLRVPGSTLDIDDAFYLAANDDVATTADTVEVRTQASGALTLVSVPAGRYVLTVKDSSHISGRTDVLTVRDGETLVLTSAQGFFASDVRGDPSFLLGQSGRLLKGGDATGDNEIDEDDVNAIDAAWGDEDSQPGFSRADVNNDGRVGVEDLAAAISNISNSTGLGAPPVYRAAGGAPWTAPGDGAEGILLAAADGQEWKAGAEVEVTLWVAQTVDLAAYELVLPLDAAEAQVLSVDDELEAGAVFAANPGGAYRRVERAAGQLRVTAARRGRQWSAMGPAPLARVRLRLHRDGLPASLQAARVRLLAADYTPRDLGLASTAARVALPHAFGLGDSYPNPFNPATTIPFRLSAADGAVPLAVRLEVFDALGQRVRTLVDGARAPGYHRETWDGRDAAGRGVASGLYFYRLAAAGRVATGRMLLLR